MQAQRVGGLLGILRLSLGSGVVWIQKKPDDLGCRNHVMEEPEPLCHQLGIQLRYSGDIAARPV
jgi:hypothetical protein